MNMEKNPEEKEYVFRRQIIH